MRMPSSPYRLLQLETHKSTSTPSTHRLSLLASDDASAEVCNRDKAAVTVGVFFASAVWRLMRLAQNANCWILPSVFLLVGGVRFSWLVASS